MGSIKLVTDIPGPRSRALVQRRAAAVSAGKAITAPGFLERATAMGARLRRGLENQAAQHNCIDEALEVLGEAFAAAIRERSAA